MEFGNIFYFFTCVAVLNYFHKQESHIGKMHSVI